MQSRAKEAGSGLDGMACEAGKGTNTFAAVPNRRDRARSQTKAQHRQPMTTAITVTQKGAKVRGNDEYEMSMVNVGNALKIDGTVYKFD